MPSYLQSSLLASIPKVRHGFFTRQGGVSKGVFATLNAAREKDDNPAHVKENRRRIANSLGFHEKKLVTARQFHTTNAIVVNCSFEEDLPEADALVTTTPGLFLGVLAADCVPILLATPQGDVVAAVHAGWRGAVGGILEATLEKMKELGAKQVFAGIGPCIWQDTYEVSQEFYNTLHDTPSFFKIGYRPGHWQFDLPGYVIYRLAKSGVQDISRSPANTFTDTTRFFSFRRKTLLGEAGFGCNLSGIGISP